MRLVPPIVTASPREVRDWLWTLPRLPGNARFAIAEVTCRYASVDNPPEAITVGRLELNADAADAATILAFYERLLWTQSGMRSSALVLASFFSSNSRIASATSDTGCQATPASTAVSGW